GNGPSAGGGAWRSFRLVTPGLVTPGATVTLPPVPTPGRVASTTSLQTARRKRRALLRAVVAGGSGPATGLVLFLDGSQGLGLVPLVNGVASLRVKLVPNHKSRLPAVYFGDAVYVPTTSSRVVIKG